MQMASVPGHPMWLALVRAASHAVLNRSTTDPLYIAGPHALTAALKVCVMIGDGCRFCQLMCIRHEWAGVHMMHCLAAQDACGTGWSLQVQAYSHHA